MLRQMSGIFPFVLSLQKELSTQSRVQSRHFTAFLYPVFFTHLSGRGRREMATLDIRQQTMNRSN